MNRPLVIYHGNCADGFSAAWCFWRKYGTGADYLPGPLLLEEIER